MLDLEDLRDSAALRYPYLISFLKLVSQVEHEQSETLAGQQKDANLSIT